MATHTVKVKVADVKEVKEAMDKATQIAEKANTMARILKTLFATEVGQVVRCRQCGCPVVHMEHLTMDEAKAIEAEVRTLLNIPATFEKYQEEETNLSKNSDWEKLSPDQQNTVNEWRDRASRLVLASVVDFEKEHPELRLTYNFTSEPLIRADHPVILEEL